MTTAFKLILPFTIFLVPLVGTVGYMGYEQAKVLVFIFLTTLVGIFWIFSKTGQTGRFKWQETDRAAGVFILTLLFTSFSGVDIFTSLLGKKPYFQGFIVYLYLFLFYLLARSFDISLRVWSWALVLSSLGVSFFAIKDWAFLHILNLSIPTYAGRVVSTFGQPNFYAGFLALSLPFYLELIKSSERAKRRLLALGFIISLLAILVSESRSSILVAGLYLLWVASAHFLQNPGRLLRFLSLGVVFVASGVLSYIFILGLLRTELFGLKDRLWLLRNAPEKRAYIWYVIGDRILSRPLTGWGLENLEVAFASYKHKGEADILPYSIKNLRVDRGHSYILDILVSSGILGLLAWGALVWNLLKTKKPKVLSSALIIYLLWIQVQIQSIAHLMVFWLLAGLISKARAGSGILKT